MALRIVILIRLTVRELFAKRQLQCRFACTWIMAARDADFALITVVLALCPLEAIGSRIT
jgi:hypothetical protein